MTSSNPLDIIESLLGGSQREPNPARERARNVQSGLALLAQKLEDLDAQVARWGEALARSAPDLGLGPSTLFRLQDVANLIGIDAPGPTPADVVRFLSAGLQAIRDSLRELSDKLVPYLDHPGDPGRILEVADSWNSQVQRPVSGLIEWFSPETLQVDNAWDGPAADAYRDFFPGQQKAARVIAERADELGAALRNLAGAIDSFWQQLDNDITGAVRHLAGMSLSLLSPDFLSVGSDILGELNDQIDGLLKTLGDAQKTYREAINDLVSKINDNEYFPGGRWPVPSALGGISDRPADWTPTASEPRR